MFKIKHNPNVLIERVEKLYSEKDGVPIKYVCTTGRGQSSEAYDVFFRETPHPEFGNRYFGLIYKINNLYIGNADWVEDEVFDMLLDFDGEYVYSRHRHDFCAAGDGFIDGGRAYTRIVGNVDRSPRAFKVKDGVFVDA